MPMSIKIAPSGLQGRQSLINWQLAEKVREIIWKNYSELQLRQQGMSKYEKELARHQGRHKGNDRNALRNAKSSEKETSQWCGSTNAYDATAHSISPSDISRTEENGCRESHFQKFTPHQDIAELLGTFQAFFRQLAKMSMGKYLEVVRQCEMAYEQLKEVLLHYPLSKHESSYFGQLHLHSTDTKVKLLAMLNQEQSNGKRLASQNEDLKLEVKRLMKLSKSKDEAYLGQAQKVGQLEDKIKDLAKQQQFFREKEKKLRDELKAKGERVKQLQANKENMMKDLTEIEDKMKTLNFIGSETNIPVKQKQKSSRKICLKLPSYHSIEPQSQNKRAMEREGEEEELYRFLLIQAVTIEQQFVEE